MKKLFVIIAAALLTAGGFSSCCSVNYPCTSANTELGGKIGEANSKTILGFIGKGGPKATLKDAAQNGGITKINHVERTDKSIFLGLVVKHTTRVYGD